MVNTTILFKVECLRQDSLNYRESGHVNDKVEEMFMTKVFCGVNIHISKLRMHLNNLYPFLEVMNIADLDGEVANEFEELGTLCDNYQDYIYKKQHDIEYNSDDEDIEDSDYEEEEEEVEGERTVDELDKVDSTHPKIDFEDWAYYSIIATARLIATSDDDVRKFHKTLLENSVDPQLAKVCGLDGGVGDGYSIRFPSGEVHKFNGHSFDGLEDSNKFIDQLLTSSEKYVITDVDSGESVELSTQQCICVEPADDENYYQPYIMVNKSGLRQLERLGPIETLKIRTGKKKRNEDTIQSVGNDTISNNYKSILNVYSGLLTLVQELNNDKKIKINSNESNFLRIIESELHPILSSIRNGKIEFDNDLKQGRKLKLKNIITYPIRVMKSFVRQWIFSGLLLSIGYNLSQYYAKCLFFSLIAYSFGVESIAVYVLIFLINLFLNCVIETFNKLAEEGVPLCRKIHNALVFTKGFLLNFIHGGFYGIALFCVSYERSIYHTTNENNNDEIDLLEIQRMQGGILTKMKLYSLRFVQDLILLILTLIPTFVEVYERAYIAAEKRQDEIIEEMKSMGSIEQKEMTPRVNN